MPIQSARGRSVPPVLRYVLGGSLQIVAEIRLGFGATESGRGDRHLGIKGWQCEDDARPGPDTSVA
jgi:hypothetical protein